MEQLAMFAGEIEIKRPAKKYEKEKVIETILKRIETAQKKCDNISTEVSGNYTPKRGREAEGRRRDKERLEMFIYALTRILSEWQNDTIPEELKAIRSVQEIEMLKGGKYPSPPGPEVPEDGWYREVYPKRVKRYNKLGIYSDEDYEKVMLILLPYMEVPKSIEEIKAAKVRDAINEVRGMKIPGFFPTPDELIDYMIDCAGLEEHHKILEPSAGIGSIPDRLAELGYNNKVFCVEINYRLHQILIEKGYWAMQGNILELDVMDSGRADRIFMNPPFEKQQDIDHVTHCFNNFLQEGGTLISVMSTSVRSNSNKKAQAFRDFVDEHGWFIELEPGQFKGSFNNTAVSTCLVKLMK